MRPNVFIPGAQKSGSTSLASYIAAHPDCVLSQPKETTFFSRYARAQDLKGLERHFEGAPAGAKVAVEATTHNMVDPWAPYLIAATAGEGAKFIFIIRSPIARTYSGYLHLYKRGHDRRPAEAVFLGLGSAPQAATTEERRRIAVALAAGDLMLDRYVQRYDDYLWPFRHVHNSLYSEQVARYDALFGRDRVLALCFEQVLADQSALKAQLGAFLGVAAEGFPDVLPHDNATTFKDRTTLKARAKSLLARERPAPKIEPVALKPSADVRAALEPVFAGERAYWSERLGADLSAFGW